MKKLKIFLAIVAIFWSGWSVALAANPISIHVEWGYTPPSAPAVTGFNLYQEGVLVCQIQEPNATAMDCNVSLITATTNFTLTAAFNDNTESPHSSPFAFATPTKAIPAPTIISITIK